MLQVLGAERGQEARRAVAMSLAGVDQNLVFGRCFRSGLLLGIAAGAASGTAAAPVLGTILGAVAGLVLTVPVSLAAAAAIARSVRTPGTVPGFRRRIDVTLAVLAFATAALAVGWISLDPLVGAWPAVTMLVTVVIGLLVVRPRLHRLVAARA